MSKTKLNRNVIARHGYYAFSIEKPTPSALQSPSPSFQRKYHSASKSAIAYMTKRGDTEKMLALEHTDQEALQVYNSNTCKLEDSQLLTNSIRFNPQLQDYTIYSKCCYL